MDQVVQTGKKHIMNKLNDQDFMQKTAVSASFLFEMYRVLMGALLIIFVPQKCGDHMCGLIENISVNNTVYDAVFGVNFATLLSFLLMYVVEVKRENRLITYLHVNPTCPNDNKSVGEMLVRLPLNKRSNILDLDKKYQIASYFSIACFIANTIFSGIVIFENYLDNKTVTAYLTNVFFMAGKLYDVYTISNTDKNVFYSAYLKNRIQYNDVDLDKCATVNMSCEFDIENVYVESMESVDNKISSLIQTPSTSIALSTDFNCSHTTDVSGSLQTPSVPEGNYGVDSLTCLIRKNAPFGSGSLQTPSVPEGNYGVESITQPNDIEMQAIQIVTEINETATFFEELKDGFAFTNPETMTEENPACPCPTESNTPTSVDGKQADDQKSIPTEPLQLEPVMLSRSEAGLKEEVTESLTSSLATLHPLETSAIVESVIQTHSTNVSEPLQKEVEPVKESINIEDVPRTVIKIKRNKNAKKA